MVMATTTGGWGPPLVTVTGATDGCWRKADVSVTVSASAQLRATSVSSVAVELDGGAPVTTQGATATVQVPVDVTTHTDDGTHAIGYYAIDDHGIMGPEERLTVKIDTVKPTTMAPRSASARRGGTASLIYRVDDAAPCAGSAKVTIKVKKPRWQGDQNA